LDKTAESVGRELTNQPDVEAEIRATLGTTYGELGLYEQMRVMAQESLRLAQAGPSGNSDAAAQALSVLGVSQDQLGNYSEAEAAFRQTLDLLRGLHGHEHVEIAGALGDLGLVLEHQDKLAEATTTDLE